MGKNKKRYQEQWNENKIKSKENAKEYNENRFVNVELGNIKVKVDRTGCYVWENDIIEVVKDLFYIGEKIEPKKKFHLYEVCNVCFDLVCDKIIDNEIRMRVC